MSQRELEEKFVALASLIVGKSYAQKIIEVVKEMDALSDIGELIELFLTPINERSIVACL